MKKELIFKKCNKCGALIEVLKDCHCNGCGIICCKEPMNEVKSNSTDAAFEKHIPIYERKDGKLIVKVNHVMEEEHFIEWICLCTENKEERVFLTPMKEAIATFNDVREGTLYAYCNKHGLWEEEVK